MPEMTKDEIRLAIDKGRVLGFAIDTAVFDKYGCNLQFPVLVSLDQFKGRSTRLIISEIVRNEVMAHIATEAAGTQEKLCAALNQHRKQWKLPQDCAEGAKLSIDVDADRHAEEQVKAFIERVGAIVVPAAVDAALTQEVLRRYFATEAPFGAKEAKKSEFPDAFALLSLEADAKANNVQTLCVSPDKGWQSFCDTSDHLICVGDINDALQLFNSTGLKVAEDVMTLWRDEKNPALIEAIESAFEAALDGLDFYPDAHMPTSFEVEQGSAVLQYAKPETATQPVIIATNSETVTFTIKLDALIAFEAEFHSYVEDSIDRDNVSLGTVTSRVEETHRFEMVLTVSREIELESIEIEVAPPKLSVHFGYVDPFRGEDPTHEKY